MRDAGASDAGIAHRNAPAEAATVVMFCSTKAPFISASRTGKFSAGPLQLHCSARVAPATHTKPSTAGARSNSVLGGTNGSTVKGAEVSTTLPSAREVTLTA
jgi:hypothetical protein